MNINDLKQENSRKIAEEVIKSIKLDEDSGAGITEEFVFCFGKDDDHIRTIVNASPLTLLDIMGTFFETLKNKSPMAAHLAEGILKGELSKKNSAD